MASGLSLGHVPTYGNRDERGRLGKGNNIAAGKLPADKQILKAQTKDHIVDCAFLLVRPWTEVKEYVERKDATALEKLTGTAINRRNFKFVQWLLEMAVGRPKFVEEGKSDHFFIPVTKEQQKEMLELTLKAREEKIIEESRSKTSNKEADSTGDSVRESH